MTVPFPSSPLTTDYTPFRSAPFQLTMGLVPLDLHEWIAPDAQLTTELLEKERLLCERHDEVFAALPEATAGATEVLRLLAEHLPARFPTLYRRCGDWLDNLCTGQRWNLRSQILHPLDVAGRLVQEDLCLMRSDAEGKSYRLVGASVCFPTRWRLTDKIGQSVGAIHAPVPGYEEQLGTMMERFFQRLKIARPVWRLNWTLIDNPALFQPIGHGRSALNAAITAQNAGEMLWLRMERQTLRRLPQSGDILFTIRVYVRPLHTLTQQPAHAAALATAIRALPAAMQRYKSLPPFLDAVLAWLEHVTPPPGT